MLFNSYVFAVFFVLVYSAYRVLPFRAQNWLLLAASYVFYGWWDWRYLSLIVFLTIINFVLGLGIARSPSARNRKLYLALSVVTSLAMLAFFKYWGFFTRECQTLMNTIGMDVSLPVLNVILPVGISFFTFQAMSYTIDVYRGDVEATNNLVDFALFKAFFPVLLAGPIERGAHLLPQIIKPREHRPGDFAEGLYQVIVGLFAKVVIADNMAPIVNTVFSTPVSQLSGGEVLVGTYAFAFQIYGDFAGYSIMARGIARWMGFDLILNFWHPYLAKTPSDFWHRWHISLSTWLRDYLYIPLGGNRGGTLKTNRNLMLTMLLGGLWHGANWTFLAWGFFHGLILCIYRPFGHQVRETNAVPTPWWKKALAIAVMFNLACYGWLLFRAESMTQVWGLTTRLFTDFRMTHFAWYGLSAIAFFAGPYLLYEVWVNRKKNLVALTRVAWPVRGMAYSYFVMMLWFFPPEVHREFIYFQF